MLIYIFCFFLFVFYKRETPPDNVDRRMPNGRLFKNGGIAFGPKIYPIPDRKMSPMTQKEWEAELRKVESNIYYPQFTQGIEYCGDF